MELGNLHFGTHHHDETEPGEELSAIKTVPSKNKRLSPAEVEQYKKEGRCFKCHKVGHIAKKCPNHVQDFQKSQFKKKQSILSSIPGYFSMSISSQDLVDKIKHDFQDVIVDKTPDQLPPSRDCDHVIKIEEGVKLPRRNPYRMTYENKRHSRPS